MEECTLSPSDLEEGLRLFELLRLRATQIGEKALEQGEPVTPISLFEQAVADMNCNKQELLALWAALQCATLAIYRAAETAPLAEHETELGK